MKKYLSIIPVWTFLGTAFLLSCLDAASHQIFLMLVLYLFILSGDFIKRIVMYAIGKEDEFKSIISPLSLSLLAVYVLLLKREITILQNELFTISIIGAILVLYFFLGFPFEFINRKK